MTIIYKYLTSRWTVSTLWNVSWILATGFALIFTAFCDPIEVLAFITFYSFLTDPYVVITVTRIGLVLASSGRSSSSAVAHSAGASFNVKILI